MNRQVSFFRTVLVVLSVSLLIIPHTCFAADKHWVIAAMVYGDHNVDNYEGFKAGLREKGYIEGENVTYLYEGPHSERSELDEAMSRLVAKKPDLIFTATTPATLAAKKATQRNKIPVVFGPVNDPLKAKIVTDLKHPDDNITGVMLTDSTAKQLEWMLKIKPGVKMVLVPYNPDDKSSQISKQKTLEASRLFGFEIKEHKVRSYEEINELIKNCPCEVDAIFLPRDGMIMSRIEDFSKLARKNNILITGTRFEMTKRGATFGFGFYGLELGKQMSRLADQIFKGVKPGDLPIETAEDYLSINLEAAIEMGITVPEHILRQAHHIIRPKKGVNNK